MLLALHSLRKNTQWVLLSHKPVHRDYIDLLTLKDVVLEVDRSIISRVGILWMNLRLPRALKRFECDCFWASLAMLPLFYKRRIPVPSLVNFHDLNSKIAPQTMDRVNYWQHTLLDEHTLNNSDRVACLSETTKRDILRFFPHLSESRLTVVYPGSKLPDGKKKSPGGKIGKLKKFILSVGTIEPRKNFRVLIEGYRKAKFMEPKLLPLVILGRKGWGEEELYEKLHAGEWESDEVYFLENASENELLWSYDRSIFLCLPSKHEGFGLPVIEAFQMKKPAILSDIPIFREVGGASRYATTGDPDAWAGAILESYKLHRARKLNSPKFSEKFWSWEKRARVLNRIFDELLG